MSRQLSVAKKARTTTNPVRQMLPFDLSLHSIAYLDSGIDEAGAFVCCGCNKCTIGYSLYDKPYGKVYTTVHIDILTYRVSLPGMHGMHR